MQQRTTAGLKWTAVRRGGIGQGCLIAAGVVLALIIAIGIWVALSWKGWTGSAMRQATTAMVQQSGLAQEEQTAILSRVDALTKDFEDGKISTEQFMQVMEQLTKSPLLALGAVHGIDKAHIEKSGLSKEEKAAGRINLQRIARGVGEGTIKPQQLQAVVATISEKDQFGNDKVKQKLTDADIQALFAKAKETADAAKVPNEPYTVDIPYEIDKAIAKALGRPEPAPPGGNKALGTPSANPTPAPGTAPSGGKPAETPAGGK